MRVGHDGLIVHDTVREVVARALRGADPSRYRHYRAAAWHRLRADVATAAPAELWRYTADMLYLLENAADPGGVLPDHRAHRLAGGRCPR